MNWQKALGLGGVALIVAGIHPAQAQKDGIERSLAGIRINSSAKSILNLFGNPNDIQIGDVAIRPPSPAGGNQQGGNAGMGMAGMDGGPGMSGSMGGPGMGSGGMMGSSGMMGGGKMGGPSFGGSGGPGMGGSGGPSFGGPGMGSMGGPGMGGMSGSMGGPGMGGMSGSMGGPGMGGMSGSMGGSRGGMQGGMMGGSRGGMQGGMMGGDTDGGMPGSFGGPGGMMGGGGGGGVGPFGQTTSSSTIQQEVTWSYSRKALDAKKQKQAIGYDFLISPEGKVSQIRITGYVPRTSGDKSSKGITLGSTYKDLIKVYGAPKSVMKSGELLVCSYPRQHIEFQLMNMKYVNGTPDPFTGIYKVVAIQINATE